MSNLKTAQAELRTFIESTIHLDGWDLDAPKDYMSTNVEGKQACTAVAFPPQNLSHRRTNVNALEGIATLDFSITFRYPTELTEDVLPHQDFEDIVEYLMAGAIMEINGCGAIRSVEANEIEFPIVIRREAELNNDWLVTLNLSYLVNYPITELGIPPIYGPGAGDKYQPYTPQQLTLGIYRSKVGDLDDNVLDTEFILTND